jgi:hypothetical protein
MRSDTLSVFIAIAPLNRSIGNRTEKTALAIFYGLLDAHSVGFLAFSNERKTVVRMRDLVPATTCSRLRELIEIAAANSCDPRLPEVLNLRLDKALTLRPGFYA